MAGFRRWLKVAAACMVVAIVAVMVLEMEVFYSYGGSSGTRVRLQRSDDIMINPAARLPNQGRLKRKNGGKSRCAGGARNKQAWFMFKLADRYV